MAWGRLEDHTQECCISFEIGFPTGLGIYQFKLDQLACWAEPGRSSCLCFHSIGIKDVYRGFLLECWAWNFLCFQTESFTNWTTPLLDAFFACLILFILHLEFLVPPNLFFGLFGISLSVLFAFLSDVWNYLKASWSWEWYLFRIIQYPESSPWWPLGCV